MTNIQFTFSEFIIFSVRKIFIFSLVFSILAAISGCNGSSDGDNVVANFGNSPTDLDLLQSAKTKWENHSAQFYTIQSQRSCECSSETTAEMKISVSDNLVLSAIDINSREVISKEVQESVKTVEGLFALIEKAIADGISIEVTYNEEFGYPELAKIDLEQISVDGGLFITLSNLEIKNSLLTFEDLTWSLDSFDSIAGPQPLIENTHISLSFDMQNMQINGMGGCNNYTADFVIDNKNNVTISNVVSTEIACSEPENVMQQEMSYFSTLAQIRFFTFDNATINMVVGGDSGLHFVVQQNFDLSVEIKDPSNELAALQSAKTKWDSLVGQYYTIQSQRSCECDDEVSAQMEISVSGNAVLSAFDITSGEAIAKEIQQELNTVDSLFTLIEKAITDGKSNKVTYNQEYGYPESAQIDLEQLAVDGGLYIRLSDLEIKSSQWALGLVTWALESFDSIAGPQALIENSYITLSIDMQNMQLIGFGGCNTYTADLVIDNKNNVTISNVSSTEMVCSEPENIMQQEMSYLATLGQIQFFTFYEAALSMVVGPDSGLYFVVAD